MKRRNCIYYGGPVVTQFQTAASSWFAIHLLMACPFYTERRYFQHPRLGCLFWNPRWSIWLSWAFATSFCALQGSISFAASVCKCEWPHICLCKWSCPGWRESRHLGGQWYSNQGACGHLDSKPGQMIARACQLRVRWRIRSTARCSCAEFLRKDESCPALSWWQWCSVKWVDSIQLSCFSRRSDSLPARRT